MNETAERTGPPNYEPAIRAVPMPADANQNGDIFGGWVLAQMDIAGGLVAARRARGRVATVAITAMSFHQPVLVGDEVSFYGEVAKVGRSSIAVRIEVLGTPGVERGTDQGNRGFVHLRRHRARPATPAGAAVSLIRYAGEPIFLLNSLHSKEQTFSLPRCLHRK